MKHSFETPDSDAIVRVDYDDIVEELSVTMRKGSRLVYSHVPKSVFKKFEEASSAGTFFNKKIRWGGKYPFLGEIST